MEQEILQSLKILEKGGIILYPTDTIWGIGCDATNDSAIRQIFRIKKRHESKALITLVSDKEMLKKITGYIPNVDLISSPTTVIYSNANGLAKNLLAKDKSAGIRIVNDEFCKKLITRFGKAIVSTSANISGDNSPQKFLDISESITKYADYIVNLRKDEIMKKPSQILKIDLNGNLVKIRS